jgi:uncharacterized metal-binding protein YceD (DUF177 family)
MDYEFSREVKVEHIDRSKGKAEAEDINATQDECVNLAKRLNVVSVNRLEAQIKAKRMADRITYHLSGEVIGEVTQESVISGDVIQSTISQEIDTWFVDNQHVKSFEKEKKKRESDDDEEHEIKDEKEDPETIHDGVINFGEVAVQFFALGVDDYPKTDAEKQNGTDYIEVKPEDAKPNPFAKLAELKTEK